MGTTACESMSVAANVFLGASEAPLLIKPYLASMTKSELHAVMTGGYATVSGAVLVITVSFGIEPQYLLSASVMSAPASLACSKLLYPGSANRTKTKELYIKSLVCTLQKPKRVRLHSKILSK